MKKTLLITGGIGYIGSHGVVAFETAWYETVIVDNLCNSSIQTLYGMEAILGYRPKFYEGDIRNTELLTQIFESHTFDGVIHFAGLKAVGESCEQPLLYHDNNVKGSLELFKCMQRYQVKKIVFSSSATVYHPGNLIPFTEESRVGGTTNPYGTTKLILEQMLEDLALHAGFQVMNLRYFNPVGAHESGKIWENPQGIPNNLLPYILKVWGGELPQVSVFGDDYDTIDGTGVRDYIDVVDLIAGHVRAYERMDDSRWKFTSYNLGVGRGISVLEMISLVEKVVGKKIPYIITERRRGDIGEVYCSPEKARGELGWKSETSIETSLKNSWNYYVANS